MSDYQWPIIPKYIVVEHDKYGVRKNHYILFKEREHSGFDITAEIGTKVISATEGIVVYAGLDPKIAKNECGFNERYGNEVEVLSKDGNRCVYGHLSKVLVKEGEKVDFSTIIGLSGCSGGSRVPHLHFEIRRGNNLKSGLNNTINPLEVLPEFRLEELSEHFEIKPYSLFWETLLNKKWDFTPEDIPYKDDPRYIR